MTPETVAYRNQIRRECAEWLGVDSVELDGECIHGTLRAIESSGATIYWGPVFDRIPVGSKFRATA